MEHKLQRLVDAGWEVMFGYIASGEKSEFIKCEAEKEGKKALYGIGSTVLEALNELYVQIVID